MKTKLFLFLALAALCGCMKVQRSDEQADAAPKKHLAPTGHYFLTRSLSKETADGVTGFPAGTEVQLLSQDGQKMNVLAKNEVLAVSAGDLTDDMDAGAAMASAEAARQAFFAAQSSPDLRKAEALKAAGLAALPTPAPDPPPTAEVKPSDIPPMKPIPGSSLDGGAYDHKDHVASRPWYVDKYGHKFHIDNGVKVYGD